MKRKLLLIASALFTAYTASAQAPLINGDLESWATHTTPPPTYEEPTGGMLFSLNEISSFPGNPPITCYKETSNVHGGSYAARMVSGSVTLVGTTIFVPGVLGTVKPYYSPNIGAKLGVPFTDSPKKFKGWFRYTSVQGDSAEISAATVRTTGGVRETLTVAKMVIKQTVSNWTAFEIPFQELAAGTPDSIVIVCVSSAGYNLQNLTQGQGKVGSTLWVDDMSFDYTMGLNEEIMNNETMNIFPNPASDMITVTYTENIQNGRLNIVDATGKTVLTQTYMGQTASVNVNALAAGMYTATLSDGKRIVKRSSFIKK